MTSPVVVLTNRFDQRELDGPVTLCAVDGAVRITQPNRAIPDPIPLQRLVVVTRASTRDLEPNDLDRTDPRHELSDNFESVKKIETQIWDQKIGKTEANEFNLK